jgi:hypothetical protein
MIKADELDALLEGLATPELAPDVAARVHSIARAEFIPPPEGGSLPVRLVLSSALVPTLLVTAAVGRTLETVHVASTLFKSE